MPYRYQIKQGAESRVFANSRRLSETLLESDEPLESVYLTPVLDQSTPAATAPAATPATPPVIAAQPAPTAPAAVPTQDNTQIKEATNN